ncbi:hypothetical protein D3C71_20330 [compost metagenome]
MKRLFCFLAALLLCAPVFAQTPKARPLTTPAFKPVLHVAQDVTVDKVSSAHAFVAPLTVSAAGLGADRLKTEVSAFDVGTLPIIDLPNPTTQAQALALAKDWINLNGRSLTGRVGNYLQRHGLSSGFFTFTQEFMMRTDLGLKKKAIAWNASVDPDGRPVYGEPKVVDPDPTYIMAMYYPKTVVSGLPQSWATTYPYAGQLRYMVLNKKFEALTDWLQLDAGGAFDQDASVSDGKLACLMDLRYPGCSGPFDIRGLMDRYGSAAAFVDYVRQLEPVYRLEGDDLIAEGAISYDKRIVDCGKVINQGYFGYALQMQAERYLAQPTTGLVKYQTIQQFGGRTISPTEPFSKQMTYAELAGRSPDRYVIAPLPGDNSLWDRNAPNFARDNNVVYVADLRSTAGGSGELNVVEMSSDMAVNLVSHNGPVREYYLGTVGDNYWGNGLYNRSIRFTVEDPKNTPEFAVIQQGWDDYMLVRLNGHIIFAGPYGGNMLSYGLEDGETVCYEECTGGGDAGCSWTTVCTKGGCPRHMAQWSTDVRTKPGSFWNRFEYGCNNTELSTSWDTSSYIDMRPWLVNGSNTLEFTVLVAGNGEGWLKIRTQACEMANLAPAGDPPPVPSTGGAGGVLDKNRDQVGRPYQ